MRFLTSLQKRTDNIFSEQISGFELFYQLTYMAATAAAGVSRARIFQLARELPVAPARYFQDAGPSGWNGPNPVLVSAEWLRHLSSGVRIGIVVGRFNKDVGEGLLTACTAELAKLGVQRADMTIVTVPGAESSMPSFAT